MPAVRTRSGLLVDPCQGHGVSQETAQSWRVDRIDSLVRQHGAVGALGLIESAELVCRKQARDAEGRQHFGAAKGFLAAADHLRGDAFLLVERHA